MSSCWREVNSIGISEIDENQKQLFSLTNQLHQSMSNGQENLVLGRMLDQLLQYALVHFPAEEEALRRHWYPELRQHQASHDQFLTQVHRMRRDFDSGRTAMGVEVMNFLQKWQVDHIEGIDRQCAEVLRGSADC